MNAVVVLQHGLTSSWCDSQRQRLLMVLGELLLRLGLVFLLWRLLLVSICASRQLGAACEAAAEPRDVTSCPAFQGLKQNRYQAALSSLASLCYDVPPDIVVFLQLCLSVPPPCFPALLPAAPNRYL